MDRGRPYGPGPGGPPQWPGDPAQGRPAPEARAEGEASSLVRPYAVTGGRTKPRYDLAIEALVTAAPYPPRDISSLTPEYRAIMDLCRSARSVAEVSALLRIPLGVARVLVADMALEGLLRLHQSRPANAQPDLRLLERVLSGLRKL
ncbi:hypothetical protein Acsp04_26850 [Actinomadura sp. NBRC 104425]|uniref:DUF742 domain-containing protein n=1 Tax=Actinomadura sp. NBRC 104425 TaxID=3032204 RepID=UPI00249FBB4B|nr:DUF742 domain-containing protein [Actinomadura sp. NBRC 104425]GLZ12450.1 hypothetical protein Acsp04_26850 [Actinomadura sp. NBRC 104425]